MAGKPDTKRSVDRTVELRIDGAPVQLNGFVQDAFQEVLVGLVRSLGEENAEGRIELKIGAVNARTGDGTPPR